ncbi:MAG: DNA polymerase III subunit delta [Clostridia bacterium]|nr:DNA polymerase III subunit delta [Clostridia bacterium]
MKLLELKTSLKNKVEKVYIIQGNDDFLVQQAITILKEALVEGFEDFNFIKIDASELKENDYKNLLNTLPFGSNYKLVIIKNLNQNAVKAIEKFAKEEFCGIVVAVEQPDLKISGELINCDHLDNTDLKKWLNNYFVKNNLKVENNVFDYIIDISSSDLAYISKELEKVAGYCGSEQVVTTDIIKLLFTKNESYFVYNLTNAIDKKDKESAFKILNSLQEDVSVGEIWTFMGPHFRKMFYCATNSKNNDILATILKTKPYAILKSRENVDKNGKSFYVNLYNKYTNLDFEIKSGKISPINAIYSLLLF